jgi:hypothetical protein
MTSSDFSDPDSESCAGEKEMWDGYDTEEEEIEPEASLNNKGDGQKLSKKRKLRPESRLGGYLFIHVYVCVCIYIYTHTYVYTYIHICTDFCRTSADEVHDALWKHWSKVL